MKFNEYIEMLRESTINEAPNVMSPNAVEKLLEDPLKIPSILFHATFKPLLASIKEKGLGATENTNWEDSKPGVVYLAADYDVAESYAESAEKVPEEWLSQIEVLSIYTPSLDVNLFKRDSNVQDGKDTFEYHGIIPWDDIYI